MKLYSLTLRAIGPFAGQHHVDFEALGRSGLFLLEGPTGAGKSTIIDAVVFALYGHLAGHGASKQRLHSHHVEPGVEPFVDLVFEVESGVHRVRRTPSFERPKKRGEGTTTVNESVVLWRLPDVDRPDDGHVISTRAQEVGDEITHLVGLRRDQFLQTVVLPQGEFATFLRAPGEERKKLLETIFRTDVYERITRELVERRKSAVARTQTARHAVDAATEVVVRVADITDDTFDIEAVVADAVSHQEHQQALVDTSRTALAAADAEVRSAETMAAAIRRRADLVRRQQRLHADQAEVHHAVELIDRARRAASVVPYVRAERSAAGAQQAAEHERDAAAEAAPQVEDPALRVDELTGEISRLADLVRIEETLPERERSRLALEQQGLEVDARMVELDRRRAARPLQRADLAERLDHCTQRLAARGSLESAAEQARTRLAAARTVAELTVKVHRSRGLVKSLAGDATTATHVHSELQMARIRGIAGELAEQLVVGEACVVCGSDSHPHPASRSDDHPTMSEIDHAAERVRRTTAALTEAQAALDVDTQQIEFWRQQADGLSVDQASAESEARASEVERLDALVVQEAQLRDALSSLDAEAAHDEDERSRLVARAAALSEQVTAVASALADDRARIDAALVDDADSLAEVMASLRDQRDSIRRLMAAATALEVAEARLREAREALVAGLTAHEFTDPDDVLGAALPTAEIERLQHRVDAHRSEESRVAEGLAADDVAALTGDEVTPDLDEVRDRRAAAADAHEAAVGLLNVARRRVEQITAAVESLRAAEAALDRADADARAVTRLAGLADATSPQNLKKLTLGTYVLLRRFADVVDAANRRLGPMSDGRYHLKVSDQRERTSSGRRTGLALAVLDAETGREREPRTLSGGETFYVSLCLALGLADVVTAESGGVQLGTLFVDEGFGTLDPQTLDDVMDQLSGLARGGRTVGLVSHVEDLKQRVADRISVSRRPDGSSTLSVLAG